MTPTARRHRSGADRDVDRPITRDDIHAKLKELSGPVDQSVQKVKNVGIAAAVAIGAVLVIGAYVLGRRKGRNRSTFVEIRRI